jgi:hypothetical protein
LSQAPLCLSLWCHAAMRWVTCFHHDALPHHSPQQGSQLTWNHETK